MDEDTVFEKTQKFFDSIDELFSNLLSNLGTEFDLDKYKKIKFVSVINDKFENTVQKKIFESANFVEDEFPRIEKLTYFPELQNAISTNSVVKDYSKVVGLSLNQSITVIVKILLTSYLDMAVSFSYKKDILKKIIFSLIKYLIVDYSFLHCYIPIYGLTGKLPKLEITNNIVIRRIKSEEFDTVTNLDLINFKYVDRKFHDLQYVLDINVPRDDRIDKISLPILESLRLLKSGLLHMGAAYPFVEGLKGIMIRPKLGDENPPEPDKLFELSSEEFEEFLRIYENVNKLRKNFNANDIRYINFAIRRFGKFYEDNNIEDKITDLTIALETLLNKESYEVTLRLSLVTAMLLGKDEEEREFLFKFIIKCYSVRSEIVHGKKRKQIEVLGKRYSDNQLADSLEEITRYSIKKIIVLHKKFGTQDNLLKNLTDLIVNREKIEDFMKFDPDD